MCFALVYFLPSSSSFAPPLASRADTAITASLSAADLLYQDQQDALLRRALHEQAIIQSHAKNGVLESLVAPKVKAVANAGTGFASASSKSSDVRIAQQRAKMVNKDGVLRIDSVLSTETCDALRNYVLDQQKIAQKATDANADLSMIYYGVENRRKGRCDLQLSLLRGGFERDCNGGDCNEQGSILADSLNQLLGERGTLRHLYEQLVTTSGEFYELAAVITDPGSNRQTIHPDLPWKPVAPLYVIFLALQDVTVEMGPTCFLTGSQSEKINELFNCGNTSQKDDVLTKSTARLSTLKQGDCVLFDARILHCGNANESSETRALFNFSFRNPAVTGDLGYKGSIRPGYEGKMTLKDVHDASVAYEGGDMDPFAKYGNGMKKASRY
ncbi:hypothetical protein ACHAWO_012263 [Cyclotella atomus]|uniref:Phytanoyl-CoA dioxygenase n=1 Tax=Cyclotella atomus TaxID=382360 RepID=A0ABD3QVX1_9STRA